MTDTNHIGLGINIDGVKCEQDARQWLSRQSTDVQAVTYMDKGRLWQRPVVEDGAFVDDTAKLMGGIIIRCGCYVGPYAVVRLDEKESPEPLILGENSNLQDGSVIHSTTTQIGANVIVAHQAIVHGAVVEDDVTIYIQAVVDGGGTVIGKGSFLHRGAYVGKGIRIPANSYIEPGRAIINQEDAVGLGAVTEDLLAIRNHVLELNQSHLARYLED